MVNRITVPLKQQEYTALLNVCEEQLRNAPDQIHWFVRRELESAGFLQPAKSPTPQLTKETANVHSS